MSNPWFKVGMEELPEFEAAYSMDAQVMEQVTLMLHCHRFTQPSIQRFLQLLCSSPCAFAGVALICLSRRLG